MADAAAGALEGSETGNGGAHSGDPEHANGAASNATEQANGAEQLSKGTLIWRALKLPIYSVALVPLLVGSACAYLEAGVFPAARFSSFLACSVAVIGWLNLSNDGFDSFTGVDRTKPESVVNLTGSRFRVLFAAFLLLFIGLFGIFAGAAAVGDARVGQLLAFAIACGYVYQCPPFRLSYLGFGEPLCFLAFGPAATTAFYLHQASNPGLPAAITPLVLSASVLVGITTTLILFCSHFHQIAGDRSIGKLSPLVRLGTSKGSLVVRGAVVALYALTALFAATCTLPVTVLVAAAVTLPIGRLVIDFVSANHHDNSKIFMAKYFCNRLHLVFGLALSGSLVAAKKFALV